MDIRTGKTYESYDDALAAGVPPSDIAEVTVTRDGSHWPRFDNKLYPVPHQGTREMRRRQRQHETIGR
jgi:hypothetical protein